MLSFVSGQLCSGEWWIVRVTERRVWHHYGLECHKVGAF